MDSQPIRSRPLSLLVRLVALLAAAGALTVLAIIEHAAQILEIDASPLILLTYLMLPSMYLLHLSYRLGLVGAEQLLARDHRRPILFLRSFSEDGRFDLNPRGLAARVLGLQALISVPPWLEFIANCHPARMVRLLAGRFAASAEEQLAQFFRRIGPFVAVGRPGERLAQGGAARLYVDDANWRTVVANLMNSAHLVIIQPIKSSGVEWELRQAVSNLDPRRVVLSFAHVRFHEDNSRISSTNWRSLRRTLRGLFLYTPGMDRAGTEDRYRTISGPLNMILPLPLPAQLGDATFFGFDGDWRPFPLPLYVRSPFVWPWTNTGANLRRTFAPVLAKLGGVSNVTLRPPRTFRIQSVLACLVYYLFAVAAFGLLQYLAPSLLSTTARVDDSGFVSAFAIQSVDGPAWSAHYPAWMWITVAVVGCLGCGASGVLAWQSIPFAALTALVSLGVVVLGAPLMSEHARVTNQEISVSGLADTISWNQVREIEVLSDRLNSGRRVVSLRFNTSGGSKSIRLTSEVRVAAAWIVLRDASARQIVVRDLREK